MAATQKITRFLRDTAFVTGAKQGRLQTSNRNGDLQLVGDFSARLNVKNSASDRSADCRLVPGSPPLSRTHPLWRVRAVSDFVDRGRPAWLGHAATRSAPSGEPFVDVEDRGPSRYQSAADLKRVGIGTRFKYLPNFPAKALLRVWLGDQLHIMIELPVVNDGVARISGGKEHS